MYMRFLTVSLLLLVATLAQNLIPWLSLTTGAQAEDGVYKCGAHIPLATKREKNKVGEGEFPFLANITVIEQNSTNPSTLNQNLVYNCTGAIITNRRILTSIKCIGSGASGFNNNSSNVKLFIRVGSPMVGGGKLLSIKKIHNITYDLYMKDDEIDDDNHVRHGLALIRLSSKIKYQLNNNKTTTKSRHRKHHKNRENTKNSSQLSINRACFNYTRSFPVAGASSGDDGVAALKGVEMFAPHWVFNYKQAKAIQMESAKCSNETIRGKAICVNRVAGIKNYGSLQEGTPLVRYTGKKRWEIIGIHSRRFEPWTDCDDDLCATETQNFIPVNEAKVREWLYKIIYVKQTRSSSTKHSDSRNK